MIKRENALVTEMNRLRTEIAHEQRVNMEVTQYILTKELLNLIIITYLPLEISTLRYQFIFRYLYAH